MKLKVKVGQQLLFAQVQSVNLPLFWSCSTESGCHVLPSVV